jgi:hypothetical protein
MLYIFLGNLPIYPPTCLNDDLVAQSSPLVKEIAWNWKITWNIPQIYAPSTDKKREKFLLQELPNIQQVTKAHYRVNRRPPYVSVPM